MNHERRPQDFMDESEQPKMGIIREFFDFLRYNAKWWLTPIVVILLLMGILIVMGGTSFAPFIYTLF